MNIVVVGTGYVGLVTGSCLADFGLNVTCLDIDKEKISKLISGTIPIYEPGLDELVSRNVTAGRLSFTLSYDVVKDADAVFLAVGTPPLEDGSADLQYILAAAAQVAENMQKYLVIINKSTVPIGTGRKVKKVIENILTKNNKHIDFDVISNPEFLREGLAVNDFMKPDRIVIGVESQRAKDIMTRIYKTPYTNNQTILFTDIESAEMIKYASNSFLAAKISFINEIANLCEKVGANACEVAKGVGLDHRIGRYSLYPGAGYGGSCFPKDVKALIQIAKEYDCQMHIVEAAKIVNDSQPLKMVEKIETALSGVKGKTIAIFGVAFKPETDDIREAPALIIIDALVKKGAIIKLYDPVAMDNAKKYALKDTDVYYAKNEYDALKNADALVVVTEWKQFNWLDMKKAVKIMKSPVMFDLRNMFDRQLLEDYGFSYYGVGI